VKIFFEGVTILLVAFLTFFTLHWYQTKQQIAKNVYAIELPQGVTKNNLNNLNQKQKTQLNNQITQLLNRKINQLTIQNAAASQPVVVVLTQNNQPILPTTPPPTSVPPSSIPPSSIPPTSEPSPTPTPTSTPTPTPTTQPPPPLAFVTVSENNFLVSNIDNGQGNWYTAKATCASLGARLPTMAELNILYQQRGSYNFLDVSYWSKEEDGGKAYYVHFSNGFNNSMFKEFTFPYFRCVKGGEATPTPTLTPTPSGPWCTDSDGGKDYYVNGTIRTSSGTTSYDECVKRDATGHFVDCSGEGCLLFEKYCIENGGFWTETYQCPNICKQGACLRETPTPTPIQTTGELCSDSDGGNNYYEKGRLVDKNGTEYKDHCVKDQTANADPNFLAEYSCQYPASMEKVEGVAEYVPEEIYLITYNCSFGCQDGVCLSQPVSPPPGSCSDSDGGANYYLKGQLTDKNGKSYKDYCVKDQNANADPDYLAEYACQSPASNEGVEGTAKYEQEEIFLITYNCPAGCSSGSCVIPVSQGTRAGFSFTQEARDTYQRQTGSNLVDDVNKIYFNGKKISGLKLDKEIKIQSLGSSGLKINYYNASTNEIVFGEKPPTKESLVSLIAVSLGDESLFLKPKTYEKEFKKINTAEINRQVFEPNAPTPESEAKPVNPTSQAPETCATAWQDYQNDKFNFKFKIPPGWTDTSIDERQTETIIHRTLVSTTRLGEQLDAKYKLSLFGVLVSTSDLKTDENYGRWFDDNTGNQKKSSVNFKGVTAEKYTDETNMICSSQTDQNPVNCPHRFERYYFKKGTFFYLINIGIYLTPDVKDKNEKFLSCFLDNFAFLDSDSETNSNTENKFPNNFKKCTLEIYDLKIGCNDVPNKPVCGFTKSVYDNGMSEVGSDIFKNACRYCSQFDPKTGFSELRGTKFYMIGYKEGVCD